MIIAYTMEALSAKLTARAGKLAFVCTANVTPVTWSRSRDKGQGDAHCGLRLQMSAHAIIMDRMSRMSIQMYIYYVPPAPTVELCSSTTIPIVLFTSNPRSLSLTIVYCSFIQYALLKSASSRYYLLWEAIPLDNPKPLTNLIGRNKS